MAVQNGRVLTLQVDTILIKVTPDARNLRVTFDATKNLKKTPNECEVKVYNLSPEHRAALTKVATPAVALSAGYKDEQTSIFVGQALHVRHERNGADIITTLGTSDSGHSFQTARIHKSFGPRTKAGDVLKALALSLGVKPGNLSSTIAKLNAGKSADLFVGGVSFSGSSQAGIDSLCRSAGLEWSIQEGALQFLDVGKALASVAIVLNEDELTTTPSISDKNVCEGQTLLQKDFLPGRQIQIKSEFVNGAFRLEKCKYTGDTNADQWYVDFEAKGTVPR